jgi:hypothetical protein
MCAPASCARVVRGRWRAELRLGRLVLAVVLVNTAPCPEVSVNLPAGEVRSVA